MVDSSICRCSLLNYETSRGPEFNPLRFHSFASFRFVYHVVLLLVCPWTCRRCRESSYKSNRVRDWRFTTFRVLSGAQACIHMYAELRESLLPQPCRTADVRACAFSSNDTRTATVRRNPLHWISITRNARSDLILRCTERAC